MTTSVWAGAPGGTRLDGEGVGRAEVAGGWAPWWWAAGELQPAIKAAIAHAAAALRAAFTARRPSLTRPAGRGAADHHEWSSVAASGRTLPADRLAVPVLRKLAAVMHQEAARASELVCLTRNHPDGQLLVGHVRARQFQ